MNLCTVVQHHPARADLLPRLLERLEDPIVVTDPGGEKSNAWRCYRLCLRAAPPDATHVLVIQDDALPCQHFTEAAIAAISARPDAAIAFFVSPQCRVTSHMTVIAMQQRRAWAEWQKRDFWPTVCSSYPVGMALELAAWVDEARPDARGDDAPCGEYLRTHKHPAYVTVPSLVEHPDDTPSLIGRKHLNGLNRARMAKWWIGDGDPRVIRWDFLLRERA